MSSLLPSHLLDQEDIEEDSLYGATQSPFELHVKCQDYLDGGKYYEHDYYSLDNHHQHYQQDMVCVPSTLLPDLQAKLSDYKACFPLASMPSQQAPVIVTSVPSQRVTPRPSITVPPPPSILQCQSVLPLRDATSSDDREEDELLGHNDEWDDYVLPTPASPSPQVIDSPPEDVGGFLCLLERAGTCFDLPMAATQQDCFLCNFKEPCRKTLKVKAMPIIDYVWSQGLKIMCNPPAVLPKLDQKYKALEDAPPCPMVQPKPHSVISQATQRRSLNPSTPLTTPPDKDSSCLDNIGKQFSANSLAILGRYNRQMWSNIAPFIKQLPEQVRGEAKNVTRRSAFLF